MKQSRTVPIIKNHKERRNNKMLWSIVSNAAERRQRHRPLIFLTVYDIGEIVMDTQKRRLCRVVLILQYAA